MSFSFSAIGTKEEVAAQLGAANITVGPDRFNEIAVELRDLLVKHFGQETATASDGYEYRYALRANGHGGSNSPLSLSLTIEPMYIPLPPKPADGTSDQA